MKIVTSDLIRRYLFKFSKEETAWLRSAGWVPSNCEEEAKIWLTSVEMELWKNLPCFKPGEVDTAILQTNTEIFG